MKAVKTKPGRREAIVYGRFSIDEQSQGDSKRRQTEGAQRYAQANGLVIVASLFDEGYSGFHGEHISHGKLGQLLKEINAGKIKRGTVLIIESFDRLSRQAPLAQITLVTKILLAGIEIVTFSDRRRYTYESFGENPHDLFGALGVMTRGNDEAKNKSRRHKENWAQKRNQIRRQKLTANGPTWLKLNAGRTQWERIEARVKLVQRMYALALAGQGAYMIAEQFNREKIPTWRGGKKWNDTTIRHILSSRAVLGEFQPCVQAGRGQRQPAGPPEPNYFPRIIEPAVFERVNAALRFKCGVGKTVQFLFAGLVFDGVTGKPMRYTGAHPAAKANGHAYLHAVDQKASQGWDYSIFEDSFLHHLDRINWVDLAINPVQAVNVSEQNRLEAEQHGIRLALRRITNILKDEDHPPRTLIEEMKSYESQLEQLDQKLAELKSNADDLSKRQRAMKDAKREFDQLLKANQRAARLRLRFEVRTLVKRIDVWTDPHQCVELQKMTMSIGDAVKQSGWRLKSDAAMWPCYRTTFANGAVGWVLCGRIRLGRRERTHSVIPAKNTMVVIPWTLM